MNSTQKQIEARAQKLLAQLKISYPNIAVSLKEVVKYVKIALDANSYLNVHLLYDFLISQDICEVKV